MAPDAPWESNQRRQFAGQVHDQIIPPLFAARMQLEALSAKLRAASCSDQTAVDPQVISSIDRAAELVIQSMTAARALLSEASAPLAGKPYWQQQMQWVKRLIPPTGQPPRLSVTGEFPPAEMPPETCLVITQVVTEAIRNAIRHASAQTIEVIIASPAERRIDITDDGTGFDPDTTRSNHGLMLMRTRMESLGGELAIDSHPGGPTRITVTWPPTASPTA